jgi:hypothetical protein
MWGILWRRRAGAQRSQGGGFPGPTHSASNPVKNVQEGLATHRRLEPGVWDSAPLGLGRRGVVTRRLPPLDSRPATPMAPFPSSPAGQ